MNLQERVRIVAMYFASRAWERRHPGMPVPDSILRSWRAYEEMALDYLACQEIALEAKIGASVPHVSTPDCGTQLPVLHVSE